MATHETALLRQHAAAHAPAATGLLSWLTTVDHKRIGILYGLSAFAFFIIGGIEALASGQRMIGVISHVPEVAERLADRIEVLKTGATSRVAERAVAV